MWHRGQRTPPARRRQRTVTLRAAAYLPPNPNEAIRNTPLDQKPYWDIERARIGDGRMVPVEIVVNGKAVAKQDIEADGQRARPEIHRALPKAVGSPPV